LHKVAVALIHLGCPKNLVDSEVLLGYLSDEFTITDSLASADVIVVNTCGFIESAKEEAIDTIFQAAEFKQDRCRALIVTGCLAQRYGRVLLDEIPEIDGILGVEELPRIREVVHKALSGQRPLCIERTGYLVSKGPRIRSTPSFSAYIKVAEGCLNQCAYCAIPLIRGKQRSRPLEQIVEEAKSLVASGVREITLIAQDTTGYGLDLSSGDRLDVLIGRLSDELPEDVWLRTLYLYPTRLTPQIISAMSSSKQFCRYMDLPLQHISEKVLKSMGRPFQKEKTDELIRLIREKMPDAALRTTFLVGFPGETDADFAELMEFVKEIRFDHVGVFAFSPEEGTKAYEMKPVVPKEIAQERADLIMKVQQEISREKNAARIGQVLEVLCTGVSEESELVLTGRTRFQAPEIDGVTYFGIPDAEVKPGDVVNVKITQALEYDLAGDVII